MDWKSQAYYSNFHCVNFKHNTLLWISYLPQSSYQFFHKWDFCSIPCAHESVCAVEFVLQSGIGWISIRGENIWEVWEEKGPKWARQSAAHRTLSLEVFYFHTPPSRVLQQNRVSDWKGTMGFLISRPFPLACSWVNWWPTLLCSKCAP